VQVDSAPAVVVVLTLVMIFSITAIQTPKAAQLQTALPPNVPLLNLYRRKILCWPKAAAAYIAASVPVVGVLLACVMLPTAYYSARAPKLVFPVRENRAESLRRGADRDHHAKRADSAAVCSCRSVAAAHCAGGTLPERQNRDRLM
jgi:hypothetical protein